MGSVASISRAIFRSLVFNASIAFVVRSPDCRFLLGFTGSIVRPQTCALALKCAIESTSPGSSELSVLRQARDFPLSSASRRTVRSDELEGPPRYLAAPSPPGASSLLGDPQRAVKSGDGSVTPGAD